VQTERNYLLRSWVIPF